MVYDIDMLRTFYASYAKRVKAAQQASGKPLTLAEKILYTHLYHPEIQPRFRRGEDYATFRPDRVAMQDATAQMALLQFMNAGKETTAVPATVHCDHLIQAYKGVQTDLPAACQTNRETVKCMTSCKACLPNMASDSGNRAPASSTRSYWKTTLFPAA